MKMKERRRKQNKTKQTRKVILTKWQKLAHNPHQSARQLTLAHRSVRSYLEEKVCIWDVLTISSLFKTERLLSSSLKQKDSKGIYCWIHNTKINSNPVSKIAQKLHRNRLFSDTEDVQVPLAQLFPYVTFMSDKGRDICKLFWKRNCS